MDPILALALVTFVLVIAFLIWNRMSVSRRRHGEASGIGGPNDPLAGATTEMRSPDKIRADLDADTAPSKTGKPL